MSVPRWALLAGAVAGGWSILTGILWGAQRRILYPAPDIDRLTLATWAAKVGAREVSLRASDGVQLYAWHLPATGERRGVVVRFEGNGGATGARVGANAWLQSEGWDVVQLNYRGYPGSDGSPTEQGLIRDAHAAWEYALGFDERPWIHGTSLGGGVAVALAAEVDARALVLQQTFSSVRDVASEAYPFLPVRWLLQDPWDSASRAPSVGCPVLLLHGDRDDVVPFPHMHRLAASFQSPVRSVTFPGLGHQDDLLMTPEGQGAVRALLAR